MSNTTPWSQTNLSPSHISSLQAKLSLSKCKNKHQMKNAELFFFAIKSFYGGKMHCLATHVSSAFNSLIFGCILYPGKYKLCVKIEISRGRFRGRNSSCVFDFSMQSRRLIECERTWSKCILKCKVQYSFFCLGVPQPHILAFCCPLCKRTSKNLRI